MLSTIKSKIIAIFTVCSVLLLGLILLIYQRNQDTADLIKDRFLGLRFPLAYHSANILAGVNRAASTQRMYMLTLDKKHLQAREDIWREEIYTSLDTLRMLQPKMVVPSNVRRVDSLITVLPKFEASQIELTEAINRAIDPTTGELDSARKKEAFSILTGDAAKLYEAVRRNAKNLNDTQTQRAADEADTIRGTINTTNTVGIAVFVIFMLIFISMGYILIHDITSNVRSVTGLLREVAKGKIVEKAIPSNNELGEITVAANILVDKFERESNFAKAVGNGDFTVDLPTTKDDVMANALITARNNLRELTQENQNALHESQAQEEELKQQNEEMLTIQEDLKRKSDEAHLALQKAQAQEEELKQQNDAMNAIQEDLKRKTEEIARANHDLEAKINARTQDLQSSLETAENQKNELQSVQEKLRIKQIEMEEAQVIEGYLSKLDDLMRLNYDKSIQEFTDIILHNVSKVTDSMRAVMFILEDQTLRAVGGYACTPETLSKREYQLGENLMGQSAKTKEFICLENLPSSTARVSSALSFVENSNIMIVPLIYNEKVQGVIELTSLKPYGNQKMEFAKRSCKNIAAMLQNIFSNMQTQHLLVESQELSSRLQVQEEETRQMLEETRATQEETQRRQNEMTAFISAIHSVAAYADFELSGRITEVNNLFLRATEYQSEELVGKHHSMLLETSYSESAEYQRFWTQLQNGKPQSGEFKYLGKNGKEIWFLAHYTPVVNSEGKVAKIISIATDITQQKQRAAELLLTERKN